MKKHIAKILRQISEEKFPFMTKREQKAKYKQLKKSWKKNVKNGKANQLVS